MSVSLDQAPGDGAARGEHLDPLYFGIFSHIAHKRTVSVTQRLTEFSDEVALADELGFDYYFTTEHHFSRDFSLSPSQAISLTTVAQRTRRIRFGPLVVVLPCNQPLRVAEEMVILDHMSGGRLEVGLGRGVRAHEHIAYGVRTEEDQERLDEGIEVLLRAWTSPEKFSWYGRHYTYVDVEMPWLPLQKPHPRIWMPTGTPAHAERIARRGWATGGFGLLGAPVYQPVFDAYRAAWSASGLDESEQRLLWHVPTVVAASDLEARELAYPAFAHHIELFEYEASRTYSLVDSAGRAKVESSLRRFHEAKTDLEGSDDNLAFLCGSPSTVREKIEFIRKVLGLNVLLCEFSFGLLDFDMVKRSMELMAREVMPNFKRAPQPA